MKIKLIICLNILLLTSLVLSFIQCHVTRRRYIKAFGIYNHNGKELHREFKTFLPQMKLLVADTMNPPAIHRMKPSRSNEFLIKKTLSKFHNNHFYPIPAHQGKISSNVTPISISCSNDCVNDFLYDKHKSYEETDSAVTISMEQPARAVSNLTHFLGSFLTFIGQKKKRLDNSRYLGISGTII
ncbi:uncharacterized protein LOC110853040 [Folsomia candida]|uniref:uncharacterized protein LOC110853040 n=1 Tax=Folsomia candida TaxID=158441 RepID=UPI001605158D|nr:uncharacterized protein LOC110853040 [Folsomia candida]